MDLSQNCQTFVSLSGLTTSISYKNYRAKNKIKTSFATIKSGVYNLILSVITNKLNVFLIIVIEMNQTVDYLTSNNGYATYHYDEYISHQ